MEQDEKEHENDELLGILKYYVIETGA